MNKEFKKEAIEAIASGDIARLKQLQGNRAIYDFLEKYSDEDGTGSVPPEAWMELGNNIDPESMPKRKGQVIPGSGCVFVRPDNGDN